MRAKGDESIVCDINSERVVAEELARVLQRCVLLPDAQKMVRAQLIDEYRREVGERRGLKILWSESSVRVRVPPPALNILSDVKRPHAARFVARGE